MSDEIAIACKGFKICRRQVKAVLNTLRRCAPWKFPAGTLSVAFVDDAKTCELHSAFLDDPSKTDVITFPGDEVFTSPERAEKSPRVGKKNAADDGAFAGEIVICVDQAVRAAKEFGTAPEDEIMLYLVHGWLHLAGIDDIRDEDRKQMRAAEAEAIEILHKEKVAPFTRVVFNRESRQ